MGQGKFDTFNSLGSAQLKRKLRKLLNRGKYNDNKL